MFERRLYLHIDWALAGALVAVSAIGLAMIYSTTYDPSSGATGSQFMRQVVALAVGIVALVVCLAVDYRGLADHALLLYAGLLGLLIYTLLFGVEEFGARRWISMGPIPFNLQPSEFTRIGLALVLATYFGDRRGPRTMGDWVIGGAFVAVPFLLIAQEPDLGTAVTLLPIALVTLWFAGLRLRIFAAIALLAVLAAPFVWNYALEDYQRGRIASFLDPERDPRGAGYQQIQARITVGSGGLTGKGFLQGTQSQYNFLPVAHNDFIFSVLAEEQGFLGVLFTLGLYLFVILRSLDAARVAKDRLGTYLVVGLMAGFAFQVIYNITMSAGLAPVKGLTLPLLSYGGSSVVATLAAFGLILNVRMRRFTN